MILGFNHNVVYKGEVFHVQTEDSGAKNPHIITLLYRGGVILCSKKTSYADILKMDNFESVVEELMKAQHKEMMRRLKSGEFDERAFSIEATLIENYEIPSPEPEGMTGKGCTGHTDRRHLRRLPRGVQGLLQRPIFPCCLPCPSRRMPLPLPRHRRPSRSRHPWL